MAENTPKISSLGDECCGCGACAAKCPKSCIKMSADGCGFLRPKVNAKACVGCGGCDSVCPAMTERPKDDVGCVLWAKSKDRYERLASSSGGVFALLAHDVLAAGGVVCGAAWSKDYRNVRHVLIENEADLDTVMRSKYAQSSVGREVYEGIRKALRDGRRALFVGTACQVAGMVAYLGNLAGTDGFLAVDVICHGVPSPLLWKKWAEHKESVAGAALSAVNMRSKSTGWLNFSELYAYAHGSEKDSSSGSSELVDSCVFGDDWYMKAFLANASLRSSCLRCLAKRSCGSDVTLGDYWGIQSAHHEVDYEGGVSAILCNTAKGTAAFEGVKSELEWGMSSLEKVLPGNPALVSSVLPYEKRDEFLKELEAGSAIESMIEMFRFEVSFSKKLGSFLRRSVVCVLRPVVKLMKMNME